MLRIGIFMPPATPWAADILGGIGDFVSEREDWSVFLNLLPGAEDVSGLSTFCGDGIIIASSQSNYSKVAAGLRIPVVNIAGSLADPGLPTVMGNDHLMGQTGARHFLELGYRNLAVFGSERSRFQRERLSGFKEEIDAHKGTVYPSPDLEVLFSRPLARQLSAIAEWLDSLPRPLGVFAAYDEFAHLVLEACHFARIPVPESVAVLGVNCVQLCRLSNPGLSSVSPDGRRRGRLTADMLHHFISRPGVPLPDPGVDVMKGLTPSGFPVWKVPPNGIRRLGSTASFAVEDPLTLKALRIIEKETSSGLHVNEVSQKAGASRRTLERRFKSSLDRSVYDEIRRQRLARACRLLTETRLSVLEIALESGFRSASDISNAFRTYIGMRPGEYRERFR